ncbi:L-threonylcarbamoyladenylate synthase [Streptomyces sp. NPDC052301]|uniref:L-threonylcarbamoyladenylate synthase n=1 Tax=Streptomyces sp. NPDC052301 TaxID=3365687 RepID=UPI0037D88242
MPAGPAAVAEAVKVLKDGGLVIAPSATHYGVFCDPENAEAVARVFEAKRRTKFGPLTLAIPDPAEIGKYVKVPEFVDEAVLGKLLPGLITPIFFKDHPFPEQMTMGAPTIGIMCHGRRPQYDITQVFGPIALTSANLSGAGGALVTREQALEDLGSSVDLFVDGGPVTWDDAAGQDQGNTVADFTFDVPYLVRAGRFPTEDLVEIFPNLVTDPAEYKKALTGRMGQVRT